ncbi:hypothetical protein J3Q64DRAFT_1766687 [Phycomyces blakesleeanus]|uniref:Uncharacterized protein n=2 Tax=Phycomyces blakesleeanus TaxID=4837 RepID=A0A167LX51_PHYB8|nr:hypothetical protein PHYBLDRAFT_78431 [Phycomyces blakesleeanus NRRL 1555(-)]OAD71268.1 hypothetical protein PHYBLDRAFT_78431 [Phycomyces blakesleeanus NRRL 1555(-)]|eukprot:XP_018289308.1 hypothetical protein PHYBLDRAFT_78431 [Phycomyces blakesleeanus NRRL 1555(-)]
MLRTEQTNNSNNNYRNIIPKNNSNINNNSNSNSTTGVFVLDPTAKPISHNQRSWSKPDGGKDNMSGIQRLLHFLLKNGGENLRKYLGKTINGNPFKASKIKTIINCRQYFLEQGVVRTTSQIKTRINKLVTMQYHDAYRVWNLRNKGSVEFDDSASGKRKSNRKLDLICPQFFDMKIIMDTIETKFPMMPNSNSPIASSDDEADEENDDEEADEAEAEAEDETVIEVSNRPLLSKRDSPRSSSPSSSSSSSSSPSPFTSLKPRVRGLGKKRNQTVAEILESQEESAEKRFRVFVERIKDYHDSRIALLTTKYENHRKDRLNKEREDREMDRALLLIKTKAEVFGWSEERFDEEIAKHINKETSN